MEFLDAFHKGDGERILQCWKYMFPHFFTTGHTKYALEAFNLLSLVHAAALSRVAHQTIWSCTVNTQGYKIPIDVRTCQGKHCCSQLKVTEGGSWCFLFFQTSIRFVGWLQTTRKGSQTDCDMILAKLTSRFLLHTWPMTVLCSFQRSPLKCCDQHEKKLAKKMQSVWTVFEIKKKGK